MLNTVEILNLIRLTELELVKLQKEIDGDDDIKKNEAGELIIQFDNLVKKLRDMYIESNPDYSVYPKYEEYINLIE